MRIRVQVHRKFVKKKHTEMVMRYEMVGIFHRDQLLNHSTFESKLESSRGR